MKRFWYVILISLSVFGSDSTPSKAARMDPFIYKNWETYYASEHGLPNDHIFALHWDGTALWVGTEGGLACLKDGEWSSWVQRDDQPHGLPWNVVSSLDVDPQTRDVWIGLFGGGLARYSAGRFDHWNQFNSGLVNDVVYGLTVAGNEVWVATTAGISVFNTISGQWDIYTERNAPMHEIWAYSIDSADNKVFAAVWGGGILEFDLNSRRWNAHLDPDGEMELDLYRDDGLIHVITTSASYVDQTLWAATYFGLSRYDGRKWRGYTLLDSGLQSEFINLCKGRSATSSYNCTDLGLAVLVDFETDLWVTYLREESGTANGEQEGFWVAKVFQGNHLLTTSTTNLSLPNHFVITCEFQGEDLWIGTGHGLARGQGKGFYPGPNPNGVKP